MELLSANDNDWLRYAKSCTTATFYHTPIWHRIWQAYEGYRPEAKVVVFPAGRKALIPLSIEENHDSSARLLSSPEGTYGGPITSDELSVDETHMLFDFISTNCLALRQNPYSRLLDAFPFWQMLDFTHVIDLRQDWNTLFSKWDRSHRSSLRRGLRFNVCCRLATTPSEWETYYELYLETVDRWDKPLGVYQWRLFDILRTVDKRYCKLWLACLDTEIIAGKVVFYFNGYVVTWHSASRTSRLSFKPNQVLHYFVLCDAVSNNYRFYDFDTSAGLQGVVNFKDGFGAHKMSSNMYFSQLQVPLP